jgi:predicted 3-demethylubiquinone-9 3-methyltransferase (glyoxalase superfamily)
LSICLWFDDQTEEAAVFYISIVQDAEIGQVTRFGKEGFEFHGKPEGTIMTVDFRLNKMNFTALNGGPSFKFNEAVSNIIHCDTQDEIDHYWAKLSEHGEEGPCGWLKDKFGVSWQVNPSILSDYLTDTDESRRARVRQAVFSMRKLEIAALKIAYEGK